MRGEERIVGPENAGMVFESTGEIQGRRAGTPHPQAERRQAAHRQPALERIARLAQRRGQRADRLDRRAIADQGRTIRVPVHMVETISRVKKTIRLMSQKLGRQPSEVEVAVSASHDGVTARVQDNGRGFELESTLVRAARDGRVGLLGMHERVRRLGGRCRRCGLRLRGCRRCRGRGLGLRLIGGQRQSKESDVVSAHGVPRGDASC